VSDPQSVDAGGVEDTATGVVGDWCFSSDECTEPGEICTIDYGDCQACQGELEICCGTCAPDPCHDIACGADCFCPPGTECPELPMACNADGMCVAVSEELGCEEPEPYDACADKACGMGCSPCAPGDEECAMRPSLPHFCDAEGLCSNNDAETLGCTETCVGSNTCGDGEVCTTAYGECITCAGEAGADPVCCGTCKPDPCADAACGDGCFFCPSDDPCPELPMACNVDGMCLVVSEDLGCDEEPPPYDACAGMSCGMSCSPCAPGDEECAMRPSLPHYCDADGLCSNNEPENLGCSGSCVVSNECSEAEVCTTEFGDCQTCEGPGGADPVCCGACVENPCNGKACGEGCACPDGVGCPEVPMACDETGSCVTADKPICEEPGDLCDDQPCGTPCGDDQICDTDGACIVSPNMPPEEFCAAQAAQCMSSADCAVGDACTTLNEACEPCLGSEMLAVCCGTCEAYDPCKDKACGAACGSCPPDQPDCVSIAVEQWCNNAGECASEQGACDM